MRYLVGTWHILRSPMTWFALAALLTPFAADKTLPPEISHWLGDGAAAAAALGALRMDPNRLTGKPNL